MYFNSWLGSYKFIETRTVKEFEKALLSQPNRTLVDLFVYFKETDEHLNALLKVREYYITRKPIADYLQVQLDNPNTNLNFLDFDPKIAIDPRRKAIQEGFALASFLSQSSAAINP